MLIRRLLAGSLSPVALRAQPRPQRSLAVRRAAVAMENVVLYRSADKVPGKYEEIGLLNSSSPAIGFMNGEEKMFSNMRFAAGQMGANAVILDAVTEPSAGVKVAAAILGAGLGAERKGKAVAIFIFPDSTAKKP